MVGKYGWLWCSSVLPPACPILCPNTRVCERVGRRVRWRTRIGAYSCALRHSPQFWIPAYLLVVATRKRKRNSIPPMTFLFLSIIIGRAHMRPRTRRNARHAYCSFSLRVAQRTAFPLSRPHAVSLARPRNPIRARSERQITRTLTLPPAILRAGILFPFPRHAYEISRVTLSE